MSVFVCLKSKSKLFLKVFSDMVYVMVVVFIKDNSFINIIFQHLQKKELNVSHTSLLSFNITSFSKM